ncbi:MAG: C45 family peptidase [Clostridia bacterium]|nr:C45 family peptidase [Clostridia bacterium]
MQYPYIRIDSADPFERGVQYGTQAKEQICKAREYYSGVMAARGMAWNDVCRFADRYAQKIHDFAPDLIEEIKGIAKGAGLTEGDVLGINLRYEIAKFGSFPECTTGVALPEATASKTTLAFKNWDFAQGVMDHIVVIHITAGDTKILGLTEAGQLIRDGFTNWGLCLNANNLQSARDHEGYGIPATILRRKALMSRSFEEAAEVIRTAPRTVSSNILLSDVANGRAIDFEWHPDGQDEMLPVDGIVTHANHFVMHPELDGITGRPKNRDLRLRELLMAEHGNITVETIMNALRDHKYYPLSLCGHPDPEAGAYGKNRITVSSMITDYANGCAWICAGPPCEGEYVRYEL